MEQEVKAGEVVVSVDWLDNFKHVVMQAADNAIKAAEIHGYNRAVDKACALFAGTIDAINDGLGEKVLNTDELTQNFRKVLTDKE